MSELLVRKKLVALALNVSEAQKIHAMIGRLQPNEMKMLLLLEYCRYLPDETIAQVADVQRKRVQRIKDNARELLRDANFLKKETKDAAR